MNCMKRLLLLLFLFWFLQSAFSLNTVYWMRGGDLNAYFSGGNEFFMAGSQPTSFSTETLISLDLSTEPKTLARWYTTAFPGEFTLGRNVLFWNTGMTGPQTSKFRVVLHEIEPQSKQETLLSESPWFAVNGAASEVDFEIPKSYVIHSGDRLVASLEFMDASGSGKIEMELDKPSPFSSVDWN